MIDHYNAFISYKHAPLDSKIAARVQRKLERFNVPPKIAKSCGKKKIERVFRDKDELPITSDLSETISHALENSDYLIVICSPETKKSIWVQREIEFFLQTHTRKQVLTVLADGDPYEVIPEILLKEEKVVVDDDGREHKVTVDLEPLSCDYTIPIKKADKIEIPRLAAALLGCSYDELMDRNRQYRMRRMALVFCLALSIMIAAASYLINSRRQIRENYVASLENRSRYLANESENLYRDQKRLDAIRLALAALPEDGDYDVMPEAVRALNDSTLAYHALSGNSIEACWNYYMPSDIKYFFVSDDRTRLAVSDETNDLIVWDTDTYEQVISETYDRPIAGMRFYGDDKLAVWSAHYLRMYEITTGSLLWDTQIQIASFSSHSVDAPDSENMYMLTTSPNKLLIFDVQTGELKKELSVDTNAVEGLYEYTGEVAVSPDETKFCVATCFSDRNNFICVFDVESGDYQRFGPVESVFEQTCWIDDEHIAVSYDDEPDRVYNLVGGGVVVGDEHTEIMTIDINTMDVSWSTTFTGKDDDIARGFFKLPALNAIMYFKSNKACVYDVATGELLVTYETDNPIVEVSDVDGDGFVLIVTTDGYLYSPAYDDITSNTLIKYHEFADNIFKSIIGGGVYVLTSDLRNELIYYNVYIYDENWTALDEGWSLDYCPNNYCMDDSVFAVYDTMRGGGEFIRLYDAADYHFIGEINSSNIPIDSMFTSELTLLGSYEGKFYIGNESDDYYGLITYDLATGQMDTIVLGSFSPMGSNKLFRMQDGHVFTTESVTGSEGTVLSLVDYEISTGTTRRVAFEDYTMRYTCPAGYMSSIDTVIVGTNRGVFAVDLKNLTCNPLTTTEEWGDTAIITVSEDGRYVAITDSISILVYDKDLEMIASIPCNSSLPVGMEMCKVDGTRYLTVIYANGYMLRYDVDGGEYKGRTKLTGIEESASINYDPDSGLIYINSYAVMDIVDPSEWYEVASVPYCLGYNKPTDSLFVVSFTSNVEFQVGYYKRYTLDELIEMGESIIGDTPMSDDFRADYGL